jgi:hypothetical protein
MRAQLSGLVELEVGMEETGERGVQEVEVEEMES